MEILVTGPPTVLRRRLVDLSRGELLTAGFDDQQPIAAWGVGRVEHKRSLLARGISTVRLNVQGVVVLAGCVTSSFLRLPHSTFKPGDMLVPQLAAAQPRANLASDAWRSAKAGDTP